MVTGAWFIISVVDVVVVDIETLGTWGFGETGGLGKVDGAGGGVSATAICTVSVDIDAALVANIGLGGTGGAATFVDTVTCVIV